MVKRHDNHEIPRRISTDRAEGLAGTVVIREHPQCERRLCGETDGISVAVSDDLLDPDLIGTPPECK